MTDPFYGYVNSHHKAKHWDFFKEPENYGFVLLRKKSQESFGRYNSIYRYVSESKAFIKSQFDSVELNERFALFIHKDIGLR